MYSVLYTRLLRHAVSLRQLTHRNIATVYDAFTAENYTADGVGPGELMSLSVYVVQVVSQCYDLLTYLINYLLTYFALSLTVEDKRLLVSPSSSVMCHFLHLPPAVPETCCPH